MTGRTDRPIRLFRRDLRYNASRVHEHIAVTGSVGQLKNALLHYTYTSLDQYFEKVDRAKYARLWERSIRDEH